MQPDDRAVPQISPAELAAWLKDHPGMIILDVREPFELSAARFPDPRTVHVPLSHLAAAGEAILPPSARDPQTRIVVICHHGYRSAQVCWWLRQIGWQRVYNLAGGLDAYAREIDPGIGFY